MAGKDIVILVRYLIFFLPTHIDTFCPLKGLRQTPDCAFPSLTTTLTLGTQPGLLAPSSQVVQFFNDDRSRELKGHSLNHDARAVEFHA